jgi:hypothetical protein
MRKGIELKDFREKALKVGHEEKDISFMLDIIETLKAKKSGLSGNNSSSNKYIWINDNINVSVERKGLEWLLVRNMFDNTINFEVMNGSQTKLIAVFRNLN